MTVIGSARRIDNLKALEQTIVSDGLGTFVPVQCDQRREEDLEKLFQHIEQNFGCLHASIINAGSSQPGPILRGDTNIWREMMEVNVLGTAICLRESAKLLGKTGRENGHIVVIGSGLGHRVPPAPIMHFYSATKHAVRALTEGLRMELHAEKSKILVTHLSPGPVNTEAPTKMFPQMPADKVKELLYAEYRPLSPQDIADTVLFVLNAPPTVNLNEIAINPADGEAIPRPKQFT
ncbi:dehydrogenase/reductase SDR family member 11-like [Paramacrobiotus metropolitanus]|uniref:dehydrogenase/reductase SDR family member 11-like n=1 Tax=Paramacrobiotus metropolitanus TaxID=2943436 RepID=UPI002445B158|nr:dehydrogenase/reductase SDR family member 11-like [Paramacrobiotus metropolitanus]